MSGARPLQQRAQRTRAKLITAAHSVFSEKGFLDARVTDIAERAGVAHGTFYTYFASKEEIFRDVASETVARIYESSAAAPAGSGPYERIEHANRRYLEAIRDNARMMEVLDQVVSIDTGIRELRRNLRHRFVDRAAEGLARLQEQGAADPELDPRYAAAALGAMVEQFAYVFHVLGDEFEEQLAVATLTRLWAQAIGLSPPGQDPPTRAPIQAPTQEAP